MKVLLLTHAGSPLTSAHKRLTLCRAQLQSLGIKYDHYLVTTAPSAATISANYDAVVIPELASDSNYPTLINNAALTIPVLALETSATFHMGNNPGVSGSIAGNADKFVTFNAFTHDAHMAFWCGGYAGAGGTPLCTIAATDPTTGSPQALAGNYLMWYATKGSGRAYFNSMYYNNFTALPFLLQAAINNGDIPASKVATLRKAPVPITLDHITDTAFNDALGGVPATIDLIADKVGGKAATCTITNGVSGTGAISGMGAGLIAILKKHQGGKFRYCWHTHNTSRPPPTSGAWPYVSGGGTLADVTLMNTKQKQYDAIATDEAEMTAVGLTYDHRYYSPGVHSFNEQTLAILSRDVSRASDPADTTAIAGIGTRWIEAGTNAASRIVANADNIYNAYAVKNIVRGITIQLCVSISKYSGNPLSNAAGWSACWQGVVKVLGCGGSVYIACDTMRTNGTPSTGDCGWSIADNMNNLQTYLKDVAKFWADPLDYVA